MRQTVVAESLSEQEARPTDIYSELRHRAIESAQMLLKDKAGWVQTVCPACDSDKYCEAFVLYGYQYLECNVC